MIETLLFVILFLSIVSLFFLIALSATLVKIANFLALFPVPVQRKNRVQQQIDRTPIVPPNLVDLPPSIPYHLPRPEEE